MRIVVFGLAVSSAWGNGHAALWRGLIRALHADGHDVTFFERDVPYYAEHRDATELPGGGRLILYRTWDDAKARHVADNSDVAIVTSYCPDARAATDAITESRTRLRCFYDLDTAVTLARLSEGEAVDYLPEDGLRRFDLVLSYTGGATLQALSARLGARRVAPLYGWVDPELHQPGTSQPNDRSALSYLGTYAADRQELLDKLFLAPARLLPDRRFVLAGSMYPQDFPWTRNLYFLRHVPPAQHGRFYASSRLTLNITRAAMAEAGWCPSGRLFEAAACGAPILTDTWKGLEDFYTPGSEILVARDTDDALAAIDLPDATLASVSRRARERTLDEHTAAHRVRTLMAEFDAAAAEIAR